MFETVESICLVGSEALREELQVRYTAYLCAYF